MDITPAVATGRQIIERYGDGRFQVSGQRLEGSVLVFPDRAERWPVTGMGDVSLDSLAPIRAAAERIDVLLLGTGRTFALLSADLRRELREAGIVVESMDTGAACRTYNILLLEERQVAAALIAVD